MVKIHLVEGGDGSGNFGHGGRPGEVGGSSSKVRNYNDECVFVSNLDDKNLNNYLDENLGNEYIIQAIALYGYYPEIRKKALNLLQSNFKDDSDAQYTLFGSLETRLDSKEKFINSFFSRWVGDERGFWTGQIYGYANEIGPNQGKSNSSFYREGIRPPKPDPLGVKWLNEFYQGTQQGLEKQSYRLYRGIGGASNFISHNSISSWTDLKPIAKMFANHYKKKKGGKGKVFEQEIPKERIFATYENIPGFKNDTVRGKNEFIVLGLGL